MADKVIFTQNDDGDAAVRVVNVNAGATEQNRADIFTTDENGNAAVRVVGGGGGGSGGLSSVSHDDSLKGAGTTVSPLGISDALNTSLENLANTVTSHGDDINRLDNSVAQVQEQIIIKSETIPTAEEGYLGEVYMYLGETDASYVHGHIYECIQVDENYTWREMSVSPVSQLTTATMAANADAYYTFTSPEAHLSGYISIIATNGSGDVLGHKELHFVYCAEPYIDFVSDNSSLDVRLGAGDSTENQWVHIKNNYDQQITANILFTRIGDATDWKSQTSLTETTTAYAVNPNNPEVPDTTKDWVFQWDSTTGKMVAVPAPQSTTATLTAAGWSNNSQTVNVSGVTATNAIVVSPAPANASDWASAGIVCVSQSAGQLVFTCTSTPSTDLTANLLIMGA